jgi:hypothetical protein
MSLSAAAIDLSKEVATEEELKNFFPDSPFRKSQRMTMEEAERDASILYAQKEAQSLDMKDLKRVFSEPTPFPPPAIPEEPSQLQVEETKEEEQRADELRHNVAVRRANLALQREMHPYVIRATAVKYLRLVVKLKNQIADEMKRIVTLNTKTGVPALLKANPSFVKGVEDTLNAMEKKLTLLIEEQNETLLPTPADLAAQVQQVLALLAETFEISQ